MRLLAAAVLIACCGGCQLIGRERPVPKQMATSRQLSQRGISALEKNDWDKGESLLEQAIKACPTDAEPHRHYAEALWHRGARDEALAQMREAMRLSGEDPSLTVRAGEMCLELGRTDEAAKLAEDAIDLSPRLACAWCLRGEVSQVRGQIDEALADALRGLEYQRDDRKLLMLAAELYRQEGRPERAIGVLEALRDGYAAGEEPPRVLYLQGLAFAALGRFDDAAEAYSVAVARERPSADLMFALADAQLRAGRPVQANAAVQQALAIDPGHAASRGLAVQVDLALRASSDFRR
jgi:tetratricopeptide (TPR) repeat protein